MDDLKLNPGHAPSGLYGEEPDRDPSGRSYRYPDITGEDLWWRRCGQKEWRSEERRPIGQLWREGTIHWKLFLGVEPPGWAVPGGGASVRDVMEPGTPETEVGPACFLGGVA
jgi:hypothetical protein